MIQPFLITADQRVFPERLYPLVDSTDHRAAERIDNPERRNMLLISRAYERICAGHVLGIHAQNVQINRLPGGRPVIQDINLHLSVSRTTGAIAIVVADCRIGIDLEARIPLEDYEDIARKYFSPTELSLLHKSGGALFYEIWTRKEAVLKCAQKIGTLVIDEIKTIDVGQTLSDFQAPVKIRDRSCSVMALGAGHDYCCSLAKTRARYDNSFQPQAVIHLRDE